MVVTTSQYKEILAKKEEKKEEKKNEKKEGKGNEERGKEEKRTKEKKKRAVEEKKKEKLKNEQKKEKKEKKHEELKNDHLIDVFAEKDKEYEAHDKKIMAHIKKMRHAESIHKRNKVSLETKLNESLELEDTQVESRKILKKHLPTSAPQNLSIKMEKGKKKEKKKLEKPAAAAKTYEKSAK
ncbi:unnamed protein product [Caenorhabditis angaria]|uniref:Uncharacterized protein n=1 Tax=Caenorhabditis angaria TaxID=860376 RepID=A0A9P1IF88_9PELO|nr:unnamed protein product [Caenorhabditis angaria]